MEWTTGGLLRSGEPHFYWSGLATLWVFSAAVSALVEPSAKSSVAYQWLYRFTHLLAANLDKAGLFQANSPGNAADAETERVVANNSFNK